MGILDDAIREHLDLKRKHGARDADLREIEDEAFGSADRPDPFAANELFNEVSATGTAEAEPGDRPPHAPAGLSEADVGGEEPTRLVEPEALRPSEPAEEPQTDLPQPDLPQPDLPAEPSSPPEGLGQVPGQVELPGADEIPGQERLDEPLEDLRPTPEPETYEPVEEPDRKSKRLNSSHVKI